MCQTLNPHGLNPIGIDEAKYQKDKHVLETVNLYFILRQQIL